MFAFTVRPLGQSHYAKVFLHNEIAEIAGFETDELEGIVKQMFCTDYGIEDMEFFEIGEYKPITFQKNVYYTLNQD